MTYGKLFELKFRDGFTTCDLMQRFPQDRKRVSEIALLDVPSNRLRELLPESDFNRVIRLKQRLQQSSVS